MRGPTEQDRARILELLEPVEDVSDAQADAILTESLYEIEARAADDLGRDGLADDLSEAEAWELLGAVEGWTGLASAAVARVYAPASPWPFRQLAGWAKEIPERLRSLADRLGPVLERIGRALRAISWSIGVNFPFGVTVTLSWPSFYGGHQVRLCDLVARVLAEMDFEVARDAFGDASLKSPRDEDATSLRAKTAITNRARSRRRVWRLADR